MKSSHSPQAYFPLSIPRTSLSIFYRTKNNAKRHHRKPSRPLMKGSVPPFFICVIICCVSHLYENKVRFQESFIISLSFLAFQCSRLEFDITIRLWFFLNFVLGQNFSLCIFFFLLIFFWGRIIQRIFLPIHKPKFDEPFRTRLVRAPLHVLVNIREISRHADFFPSCPEFNCAWVSEGAFALANSLFSGGF